MKMLFRFYFDDRGQSVVELAIIAPLFLLLLFGAIDVGAFMYDGIEVSNAARAGVQYGISNQQTMADPGGIRQAALDDAKQVNGLVVSPNATFNSYTYCACDKSQGTTFSCTANANPCPAPDRLDVFVEVDTSAVFPPLITFPGLPATLTIAKSAVQIVSPK